MSTEMTTQVMQTVVNQGVKPSSAVSAPTTSQKPDGDDALKVSDMAESQMVEGGNEVSSTGNESPLNAISEGKAEKTETEDATQEQLKEAVSKMNDFAQNLQRDLKFSVDDSSGQTVVRVIDSQTDEVVRQIPSEEALDLMNRFQESTGLIFKREA